MSAYSEVVRRFGRPHVTVFSATEYRVWVQSGWHVHDGAASGDPSGDGKTLGKASQALLNYIAQPHVMLVHGTCDQACCNRYNQSRASQLASKRLWQFIEEAADNVERWPAWKRGLPPCAVDECYLADGHKGVCSGRSK